MAGTQSRLSARMRGAAAVVAVTTAALVLSGCGSSVNPEGGGSDGPLRVGVIVPATGPISSAGLALQHGFEVAVDVVNAEGGVNGQPVEYTVEDDRSDPAASTQIANKFTQSGEVSLLFGTITGDTAAAVTAVAENAKVPFATSILGDPAVCSPYGWGFGESIRQLLKPGIPALIEQYGPRVALVGSDYNFPHDYAEVAKGIIADNGGTVVADEYSPLGTTDFESTITRLKAAEPDVLLAMVVGADAITFTQQAAAFGLLTPDVGFEGAPTDADYYLPLADIVNGRDKLVRWSDGFTDDESVAFVEAYREKSGNEGPVPEVAASAYFAFRFIAAAAEDAGANDAATINEALGDFQFTSPLGENTHFAGESQTLQANMFLTRIQPGGTYEVVEDLGFVEDTEVDCA
jgi:ABC-type branched-subunit amino acid transport system substrate-binding protein